ncbi:acyl-CoA desaturase [Shewanella sp. YIC-542]|uniref:acyl-CoA desaturase n=1 Tax=Shewanella mytili TaxID=3377111 RepID=UPI00398F269C
MKQPPLIWINLIFFITTFAGACILVPWRGITHGFDATEWSWFVILAFAAGLSITAGYHRLWSHKTYKAHPIIKVLYALGGALAFQNSVLHWASDHRVHHKHVDNNDKDPYSAQRGFWFSHIGWMLREYQPQRYGDYSNVRDLQQDAVVRWQHKHYLWLAAFMNIAVPLGLGWLHGDILSMLLLAGLLRLVVVHHCTFFINSLAHVWGKQPYTDRNSARDNGILALLTYGEGYHNFHHIFEHDYRNGIRWWHYDPTKWLIRGLAGCGLATDLRRVPQEKIDGARLQMQLKRTQKRLLDRHDTDELLAQLQQAYEDTKQHLCRYYGAKKQLLDARKQQLADTHLKPQVAELKRRFRQQQRQWQQLTANLGS